MNSYFDKFFIVFMFKQPLHILLLVIFSIPACSLQKVNNSMKRYNQIFVPTVVNGWPAKLGDVPYQISFKVMTSRYKKEYSSFCGGVLISPDKLVSAAHCFEEKGSKCFNKGQVSRRKLSGTWAVAGNLNNKASFKSDSLTEGQWRKLKSMVYPPSYKFPKSDISVGFTRKPFTINENVAPIPWTNRFNDYRGKCLVSGYGRISNKARSEILLLGHLELTPLVACSRKHRKNMIKFVCSEIRESDVGKGDSGGPLVCLQTGDPKEVSKGILVGIVSGTSPGVGSFFTRVSSYSKFIANGRGTLNEFNKALLWLCLIIYKAIVISSFCFHFGSSFKMTQ